MLADLEAESYIGVPLFDSNRQPLGLLAAIKRVPIENPDFAEYIMRIFAARTSGEMERKRSLQELLDEKKLTETIVDSLPGLFYMFDDHGNVIWRNKAFQEAAGLDLDERAPTKAFAFVLDDDKELAARSVDEAFETGAATAEIRARRADGSVHTLYCTGARVEMEGSRYVVGTAIDITELKQAQEALRDVEHDKRRFYRETIFSVTDGKLTICEPAEAEAYVAPALIRLQIASPTDLVGMRDKVREFCVENGLVGQRLDALISGVGEAATNAIKHANGGTVCLGLADGAVWVAVSDCGPGIQRLTLPRALLLRGFSTKRSLGIGYTLILDAADRILLATGRRGTTVVLVKEIQEKPHHLRLDEIPDEWDSPLTSDSAPS